MNGEKVSERQSKGALNQAVGRIANLKKRAAQSKEAMAETGAMVLHTAENQGSLFLASLAEGYLGTDKMKLGGVDVRAPVAVLAQGYGLFEAMSGRRGGNHALAIGNGIMGSWLASVAVSAGRTLSEKKTPAPTTPQPTAAPAPAAPTTMQGVALLPEPGMHGPMREVLLTPEPQPVVIHGPEYEGRPRHRRHPRPELEGQDFQGRPPRRRHPRPDLEGDFEGRPPRRRHHRPELEGREFEGRRPRRRHPHPELEGDDFEGPHRRRPPRRRRIPAPSEEEETEIEGRRRGPRRGPGGGRRRGRRLPPRFRRQSRFVRPDFDDDEDEDIEHDE